MSSWELIETAPKDGTYFLMFWPKHLNIRTLQDIVSVGCIDGDWWEVEGWTAGKLLDEGQVKPTHWMPFPEPPIHD